MLKIKATGKTDRFVYSNYKIDFLFATIGGCFLFYFLIFSCFGRWRNEESVKSKLAEELYGESTKDISFLRSCWRVLTMSCQNDEVLKKI